MPINGRSLRPVLDGVAAGTHAATTPIGLEVSGNSALFLGAYKITRNSLPYGDGIWRLYNLDIDPGETNDLAATEPDRMQTMLLHYQDYVEEFGVVALEDDFNQVAQITANIVPRILKRNWWVVLIVGIVLISGLGLAGRFTWRKFQNV